MGIGSVILVMLELWASANDWSLMLLTLQLKLKIKKGHTPSITTVTITVYLKENGNKKNKQISQSQSFQHFGCQHNTINKLHTSMMIISDPTIWRVTLESSFTLPEASFTMFIVRPPIVGLLTTLIYYWNKLIGAGHHWLSKLLQWNSMFLHFQCL